MSWSYRVVHTIDRASGEDLFQIVEAYEDPSGYGEAAPFATSLEDLRWMVGEFGRALDKPVIEVKQEDLPGD